MEQKCTHGSIMGCMPVRILPEGAALVLEGGGTRGFYIAGVFEAFMDAGILYREGVAKLDGILNRLPGS